MFGVWLGTPVSLFSSLSLADPNIFTWNMSLLDRISVLCEFWASLLSQPLSSGSEFTAHSSINSKQIYLGLSNSSEIHLCVHLSALTTSEHCPVENLSQLMKESCSLRWCFGWETRTLGIWWTFAWPHSYEAVAVRRESTSPCDLTFVLL